MSTLCVSSPVIVGEVTLDATHLCVAPEDTSTVQHLLAAHLARSASSPQTSRPRTLADTLTAIGFTGSTQTPYGTFLGVYAGNVETDATLQYLDLMAPYLHDPDSADTTITIDANRALTVDTGRLEIHINGTTRTRFDRLPFTRTYLGARIVQALAATDTFTIIPHTDAGRPGELSLAGLLDDPDYTAWRLIIDQHGDDPANPFAYQASIQQPDGTQWPLIGTSPDAVDTSVNRHRDLADLHDVLTRVGIALYQSGASAPDQPMDQAMAVRLHQHLAARAHLDHVTRDHDGITIVHTGPFGATFTYHLPTPTV